MELDMQSSDMNISARKVSFGDLKHAMDSSGSGLSEWINQQDKKIMLWDKKPMCQIRVNSHYIKNSFSISLFTLSHNFWNNWRIKRRHISGSGERESLYHSVTLSLCHSITLSLYHSITLSLSLSIIPLSFLSLFISLSLHFKVL